MLGVEGEHNTEIHSILAEHGLPYDFESEIKSFADNIDTSINKEEILKRRDFRKELTFTIDPVDAKDFDDANPAMQRHRFGSSQLASTAPQSGVTSFPL